MNYNGWACFKRSSNAKL